MYFAEMGVDVAIVEVGMGGLLDATNVVEPLVSVITNIGLDHMEYLGDTKEKIAREKAGIIKNGAPVVTGEQDKALLAIIKKRAQKSGGAMYEVGKLVPLVALSPASGKKMDRQTIAAKGIFEGEFELPLLGAHQVENAASALSVLHVLRENGFDISWNDIQQGMAHVKWEGRLDVVSRNPLVVVDGAHNSDGVEALYEFIKDWPRHDVLVLGEKRGKDMGRMAELIAPLFGRIIVTKGAYMAEDPGVIAESLRESGYAGDVIKIEDAGEAVRQGREFLDTSLAGEDGGERLMLVAGSLYVAADALVSLRG